MYLDYDHAVTQIGDPEALTPLLVMLQESLARDLPLVDSCLHGGDVAGVNRLLHPIKGFLPIFCQDALCQELSQVEGLSKYGSASQVAQAYASLRPKLESLLGEVSAYLQSNQPP